MADKYPATLLAQNNEPLEIQKADLDLLKKINIEASSIITSDGKINTLNSQINTTLELTTDLDSIPLENKFFSFYSTATGAPNLGYTYYGTGIQTVAKDQSGLNYRYTQIINFSNTEGVYWRTRSGTTWSNWRLFVDDIIASQIYSNDFLHTAASNVTDGFVTTVVASGTIAQGAADVNHPGKCRITSSTSANSGAYISTQTNALTINSVKQFSAIYRPLSFIATTTTRLGIHNTLTVTAPTLGVYFEVVGSSCTAKVIGTYGSYTSAAVVLVTSTWYQFTIKMIGDVVNFIIYDDSGTVLMDNSTTITLSTTVNSACFISTTSGIVATALSDVDLIKLSTVAEIPRYV